NVVHRERGNFVSEKAPGGVMRHRQIAGAKRVPFQRESVQGLVEAPMKGAVAASAPGSEPARSKAHVSPRGARRMSRCKIREAAPRLPPAWCAAERRSARAE